MCLFLPVCGLHLTWRFLASSEGACAHSELSVVAVLEAQAALLESGPFEPLPLLSFMMTSNHYTDSCMQMQWHNSSTLPLARNDGLPMHLYMHVCLLLVIVKPTCLLPCTIMNMQLYMYSSLSYIRCCADIHVLNVFGKVLQ